MLEIEGQKLMPQLAALEVLKLHPEWAPRGVRRFVSMLRMGDLEGSRIHHVQKNAVLFGLPAEPTLELDKIRNDRVRAARRRT